MTFTASVTDFNNAMAGSIFHPEDDYYGPDGQIVVSVNDLGKLLPNLGASTFLMGFCFTLSSFDKYSYKRRKLDKFLATVRVDLFSVDAK